MRRTVPRSLRRLVMVVGFAALPLAVCGISLAAPARAGPPAPTMGAFFAHGSGAPPTRVLFAIGAVVALLGVAAVVLGVWRGRRRQ